MMKPSHKYRRLRGILPAIVSLLAMILWGMPAAAQQQFPAMGVTVVISGRSSDNQHPSVAASEDGRFLVCAWDGVIDGARRIILREKTEGVWLPERIVDTEPLAENRSPVVAVDSAGTVHVAWLGQVRGRERVFYATSIAGRLLNWGALDGGEAPEDSCGKIVLRLDQDERPWLAWEAGRGTRISIRCAYLEDGVFRAGNLTPAAANHNWFPELFFTPEPIAVWYADQISEFALQAARYDLAVGKWQPFVLAGLEHLPKSALPQLARRSSGSLTACWIEDISAEGSSRTDYVLVADQGLDDRSAPSPIDFETSGTKESLARTVAGERLVLAWCSKSLADGWQIYLAAGSQPPFLDKAVVTDGARSGYYDHPAVAAVPGGAVVVWHSSEPFGGDGRVFCRSVHFESNPAAR